MKRRFAMFAAVMLASGLLTAQIALAQRNDSRDERGDRDESAHAFLGLAVEPVPPALMSHLRQAIGEERGVLVSEVAPESPADKAGLRQHDVIISFDDQRVYSPEQFVKMVRNEKPGREATLKVARNGRIETVRVTLGERSERSGEMHRHRTFRMPPAEQGAQNRGRENWELFDAMSLERLDKNRFRAEIKYRDDNGKVDTRRFEGTMEEIRKDIASQHDLPSVERQHLLDAVSGQPAEFQFPNFGPMFRDFDRNQQ